MASQDSPIPRPDPTSTLVPTAFFPRKSTCVSHPPDQYAVSSPTSMTATLSSIASPSCYNQAMEHGCWQQAMQKELDALAANQTWDVVQCPPSIKPIGSKWVYSVKLRSDGSLERYKARFVALGNHQEYGIDYDETFALVAKITTVRLLLALAASKSWQLRQMDVKNAFLHVDLKEDIYMKLPSSMPISSPMAGCKLKRSLYGLKQAH